MLIKYMNKIKMVLKRFEKDSIHMVVTLLIAIFASCDNRHSMNNGVTLEEFAIDNIGLDCVIQSVFENKTKAFPCIESDTEKVLSLNLQSKDSVILFVFFFLISKRIDIAFIEIITELSVMLNIRSVM